MSVKQQFNVIGSSARRGEAGYQSCLKQGRGGLAYMGHVLSPGCYHIFIVLLLDREDHPYLIVPCSCYAGPHNL